MRRLSLIIVTLLVLLSSPQPAIAKDGTASAKSYPGTSFRFVRLSVDEDLSQNAGLAMYQNGLDYLWFGTQDGLNRYDGRKFPLYKTDREGIHTISHNNILSIFEDRDGMIWVGTCGIFTHLETNPSDPKNLGANSVMSLFADESDNLWISSLGCGLSRYAERRNEFTHFRNIPGDPSCLLEDQETYIVQDENKLIWVTTLAGLARLDEGSREFVIYPIGANGFSAGPNYCLIDGNILWVASWGAGLYKADLSDSKNLNPQTTEWISYVHDSQDKNSLSENGVWVIRKSKEGMLWLAALARLNRFDSFTERFELFNEKDGFHNVTILGLLEDVNEIFWITTNDSLDRFNPQTEAVTGFDKADSIQGNEFNSNAYFNSQKTGDFYFGGHGEINVFNPLEISLNQNTPNIVITDFKVFNDSQPVDFRGDQSIVLNYKQNFIFFEFAALYFQSPTANQYAYMLENFDSDLVNTENRIHASYTKLPGSNYVFRVKATNNSGVWNESRPSLHLRIILPIWQIWQFVMALALFVIGVVAVVLQLRVKAVCQNAARLESLVTSKTADLHKANEMLQKMAAQEAVIAERTRLARDLHDAVTQTLFSATLIADVLPDIWRENVDEGINRLEELRQLTRGALAEMRTLLVELGPNELVDVALPVLLRQLTEAMIGRARIRILLNIEGEAKIPPEVQVGIYRITQEALNNISKHAKASQALVNLRLGDPLRLTIEDDGVGFEHDSVTADHLGLKIMYERAESIGAKLSVYSEPGEGTQVSFVWQAEK